MRTTMGSCQPTQVTTLPGLYKDPPWTGVMLGVSEESQIQAPERTQPLQPRPPSGTPATTNVMVWSGRFRSQAGSVGGTHGDGALCRHELAEDVDCGLRSEAPKCRRATSRKRAMRHSLAYT